LRLTNIYLAEKQISLAVVEDGRALALAKLDPAEAAFASVAQWLRSGADARSRTLSALRLAKTQPDLWQTLDSIQYAPLVDRDCRIFCVGLNYADHAAENNLLPPTSPVFFSKLSSTVTPHDSAVELPQGSEQVDYEAEFAFMIGRKAKCVSASDAAEYIAGYTIMNDVSARDMQSLDGQWFRGKNCDTFAPLGPCLVTSDEVKNPGKLVLQMRLNGKVRQNSNISNLVFDPSALLSFLSQNLTLEPGDIISTGTPGGIGFYANPKVFLQPGDVMEVEIEEIGILRNTVVR
jgi:2-keto-4-pentenoate hydratase/2-oxohepta-3-ene-1,7-dioic acid hydratase in catechol pathway